MMNISFAGGSWPGEAELSASPPAFVVSAHCNAVLG